MFFHKKKIFFEKSDIFANKMVHLFVIGIKRG